MDHAMSIAFPSSKVRSRDNDFEERLDVPFDFEKQPDPLSAALRPQRRVPLLLLLVAKNHGAGASWKGLQLLNWAVRDPEHSELLLALQAGEDIPDRPVVRFESVLDRALDLAIGLNWIEQPSARLFRLTEVGGRVLADLERSDAFAVERGVLSRIKGKVTKREVDRLLEWRDS
jgi:hypothetical protein